MGNIEALRIALDSSRTRLFAGIRGLNEEQFRFAGSDGWSIATHLAHLLRCERMLAERIGRALDEDTPIVASTGIKNEDDPGLAQKLAVPQIIHGMQASRRDVITMLDSMDESSLQRAIAHERDGRVTVSALLHKLAAHEAEHAEPVEQLAKNAQGAQRLAIPITPQARA